MPSPRAVHSFVLDGQGIPASTSSQTIQTALHDAQTPLGRAVLLSCYQAFVSDYQSLSSQEQLDSGLTLDDCPRPESLLDLPERVTHNAIVGNTHLYLIQILRYIANVGESVACETSDDVGVLGFSTGMIAATVIACANAIPSFILHATEAFRLAFWIGLRAQQYVNRALPQIQEPEPKSASWTLVVFGSTRSEVQEAVDKFNEEQSPIVPLHVTGMTTETCSSVSGHPNALATFRTSHLPPSAISSRPSAIHTLYHCPELAEVKTQIMSDLASRDVRFPEHTALCRSLRSTATGEIIPAKARPDGVTLAEEIVDMTVLHPVNFDRVVASIKTALASQPADSAAAAAAAASVSLVNLGPGNVLWKGVARSLADSRLSMVDWSSATASRVGETPSAGPRVQAKRDFAVAREPIAIVGMAVKFPGAADLAGLWEVLEKGLNTVSEIPEARFNVSEYNAGAHGAKRALKTKFGNFLDDPDVFDNVFFRVSPREARSMDPQQRLLLHVAYHALENAGYVPGATPTFNPDTFATYVGVATNDYVQNLRNDVDVYYSTGTLHAFLSGKISYAFKFSGPSLVIDTACSSSMVAIYQACRSLVNGDCNAAIAGGVNVMASPDMYLGLDRAHFLSATGQCKPWDASADGYCRSEGCGMFVLKRLSDAVAENDNILGVIRGIELNQAAHADSITQPHVPTQVDLFKKLISSTGIEPHRISVVEAHGTGTKAGDPTEIRAIRSVFAHDRTPTNPLHLTSIKANIGHAEAASGAASLAKLLLMFRKNTIPPVISLKSLNPTIPDLASDGTCIPTQCIPWHAPNDGSSSGSGHRRLALLNNFGAAGSTVAMVLEEPPVAPPQPTVSAATAAPAFVVGISCDSEAALETQRAAFLRHIDAHAPDARALTDLAYTAVARRQQFRYRLAAAGATKEELVAALRRAEVMQVAGGDAPGKTVFVFSGQGGQYVGMGAALYRTLPAFRAVVDGCHKKLLAWGFPGILDIINPEEGQKDEDFRAFQSAVFVLEYALAAMWKSWGLKPDAVVGHSLGEYAALVAADVLSLDDALRLVAGRANLMGEKCVQNETGMLAVKLSPAELERLLRSKPDFDQLSVACHNSCEDGVVAGKLSQLEQLQSELKASGKKCAKVNVPYGYHTDAMKPILDDITALASQVTIRAPSIPVISNVHGTVVPAGDASVFTPEYFARHCGEPVKFEQGINDLMARDDFTTVSAWIEVGPHPTSLPMLRSIPATSQQAMYLPSLRKNTDAWEVICGSLAGLYCIKNTVNWRAVFADLAPNARVAELPAYPFAKTRFWIKYEEGGAVDKAVPAPAAAPSTRFSLLTSCVHLPAPGASEAARFETPIDKLAHLIEGHQVAGHGLCPASVYIEMASAGAQLLLEHLGRITKDDTVSLSDITFSNPLVYAPGVARTVRLEITLAGPGEKHTCKFAVSSYTSDSSKTQPHCAGLITLASKSNLQSKFGFETATVERRQKSIVESKLSETFFTRTAYDIIFSRIVAYSPTYHTMKSITIDSNGADAYAAVQLPPNGATGTFVAHPVFMDTLLHAVGFVINCNAGQNEAFICSQVDKVKVIPELIKHDARYGVYCNIGFISDSVAFGDAYAYDVGTSTMVAVMKRMQFKKLRMSGFKAILGAAASHAGHHTSSPSRAQPAAPPAAVHQTKLSVSSVTTLVDPAPSAASAQQVKEIMANALGVPLQDVTDDKDLERLGLDSLTSIEAHHALCQALNTSLPEKLFTTCKTIGDVCAAVGANAPAASPSVSSPADPVSTPLSSQSTLHEPVHAGGDDDRAASLVKVKEVMASVLGVAMQDLGEDKDLEQLGMDSLMSIEALHALSTTLGTHLPEDLFTTCKTIRDIQDVVSPAAPQKPSVTKAAIAEVVQEKVATFGTDVNPVLLQTGEGSSLPPLFLIHDGSGVAHQYGRLASLGRQVWGIHNPKFPTGGKWEGGLLEMARTYAQMVREKLTGSAECVLGGWSIGGVIAFEVARQLISSGVNVRGLVLIDSPHPETTTPLSQEVIDAAFSTKTSPTRAMELARSCIQHATAALVEYDPLSSPAKAVLPKKAVMLRSREAFNVQNVDFSSQSGKFLAERGDPTTMVQEWERLLGTKVPVLDIPGNHFQPFDPRYVGDVSNRLAEALTLI